MNTVDRVIYEALVKKQSVVLPGVGSLEVKHRGAKRMAGGKIIPPQNVVYYLREELAEGTSILSLLSSLQGVSGDDAAALYDSWLAEAVSPESVSIKEVGDVRDDKFMVTKALHNALNPSAQKGSVQLKTKKKCSLLWLWIALGVVVVAVALLLLSYFGNGFLGIQKKPKATLEVVEQVVVAEPVVEAVVAEPGVVLVADSVAVADSVVAPAVAPVKEVVAEKKPEPAKPAATEPVAEKKPEPAKPAASEPVATAPAYHVIAGSFKREANADSFVKKLQATYPDMTVQKIKSPNDRFWFVSVFSAPTEREAYNATLNKSWNTGTEMWVFKKTKD
jgi:hypothetical protein